MDSRGSAKVQGDVHFSDPTAQAPGCPVRAQSQEGHVAHALSRPKVGRVSPALPRSKLLRFLVVLKGPVPVEPCISCSSQAQAVQTPQFYAGVQSLVSSLSPALPRPKLLIFLGVL